MRGFLPTLLAVALGGAAFGCPLGEDLAEGMYWTYRVEVTDYLSPWTVSTHEFTLTIQTGHRVEGSPCPACPEGLFQGWSLEATLDTPWERRTEALTFWQVAPSVSIARWPLPVLFVTNQVLPHLVLAAATVGIVRTPEDGSAVQTRVVLGREGAPLHERVALTVNYGKGISTPAGEFWETCRVDYEAEGGSGEHHGIAWWSGEAQGWVHAEGEVTQLHSVIVRYRIELTDWGRV